MPNEAARSHAEHVDRFRWFILLGLITAAMMEILDTTIINVALPRMAGNLSATQEEIAWVSTSYILANVVVLPMTAFFTETFGRKRYLTFSIILFIVASFLCGTATSLGQLVVYRLIQGAGGAALLSTAQATLRQIFPKEEQNIVQAIFMVGVIVARRSAAGSRTTTVGDGASSSTCRSALPRRFSWERSCMIRPSTSVAAGPWTGSASRY
jgi:MFS transporter, DHA2 family, multidrug resistance protein